MQPSFRPTSGSGARPLGPQARLPPPQKPPDGYRPTIILGTRPYLPLQNPLIPKMTDVNPRPRNLDSQDIGAPLNTSHSSPNPLSNGISDQFLLDKSQAIPPHFTGSPSGDLSNPPLSMSGTHRLPTANTITGRSLISVNSEINVQNQHENSHGATESNAFNASPNVLSNSYASGISETFNLSSRSDHKSDALIKSMEAMSVQSPAVPQNSLSKSQHPNAFFAPTGIVGSAVSTSRSSTTGTPMARPGIPPGALQSRYGVPPQTSLLTSNASLAVPTSPNLFPSSLSDIPHDLHGSSSPGAGAPPITVGALPSPIGIRTFPGMPVSSPRMFNSSPAMPPTSPGFTASAPGIPPTHSIPSMPGMPPPPLGVSSPMPGMQYSISSAIAPSGGVYHSFTPSAGMSTIPGMAPPTGSVKPPSGLGIPGTRPGYSSASPLLPPLPGVQSSISSLPSSSTSNFTSSGMSPRGPVPPVSPGVPGLYPSPHIRSPSMPQPVPQMTANSPTIPPPPTSVMQTGSVPPFPIANASSAQQLAPTLGGMQNRYPGSPPSTGGMAGYPQSQGRRLNPDDMPSPLQVMEEDCQSRSGEFCTNTKGAVPPLVTTNFFVRDGGNASPRFIRSTMYSVPATPEIMKQTNVPFGLIISPFADLQPNEGSIYLGTSLENGPVRCNRCKAYMSPLMVFMNGGRRFQCLLCKHMNEVPPEYHCHMDSQGVRADKYQRPELCLGTFEFLATDEYCQNKVLPKEPAFIFIMEMNQIMMQRGIINVLCQNMTDLLQNLPLDQMVNSEEVTKSPIKVGFITYDSSVHFYKINGLAPEMCILCDQDNMFVPVPDGVLCDPEVVSEKIDSLMECIPENFHTTRETSGNLYGAIEAGMAALKASGRSGKLFVFHSSLPMGEGLGKLKNRDDRKALGSENEKAILTPQNQNYNKLAQELVSAGVSVDLYIFNESYVDLATIGQVAHITGGQCYKYTYFQANKDSERFLEDLRINIGRNIAFDAVMRVRTSTGVRPSEFYGHFSMSNTKDIDLASMDSSKVICIEVKHDDKITEEDGVYVQVALLYTSISGQRRIRIINLALNICTLMADMYKNCELDALMNFFGKEASFKYLETSAKQVTDNLVSRTAQILACYRKNCATPSSAGQLILPELMKLLPLYVNCLIKCDAMSGGQDLTCDDRSWHTYQLQSMSIETSVVYLYPRLIPLTDIDLEATGIPEAIRASYDKLTADNVYLLENGFYMFMWVGSNTASTWMMDVFAVSGPHQLDPVLSELPELENASSKRVRRIIAAVREQRKQHMRLFVVPQQGKHEIIMKNYLVEDKTMTRGASYVDFLCHIHKEIRSILS